LLSWRKRASWFLPVPVSPVRRTEACVPAARCATSRRARKGASRVRSAGTSGGGGRAPAGGPPLGRRRRQAGRISPESLETVVGPGLGGEHTEPDIEAAQAGPTAR